MRTTRISLIFAVLVFCCAPSVAEVVGYLKDDMKALMPYDDWPSVEGALGLIPDNDPLVKVKRSEVLLMLSSLAGFFPEGKQSRWDDLEKTYKKAYMQDWFEWRPKQDDKELLKEQKFSAYKLVVSTYFPEAFELRPSVDGSHKVEAATKTIVRTVVVMVLLLVVVIVLRLFRRG
jgi:hypothetical protein